MIPLSLMNGLFQTHKMYHQVKPVFIAEIVVIFFLDILLDPIGTGIGFVALNSGFDEINIGDVLTLFSGIFYALQIIIMEQYIGGADSVCISTVEFATSALICWVGASIFESVPQNVPMDAWLNILYLSVFCTGVCFFLQAWGMRYTPSSTAAMLLTL